ncbi:response regulator transcription factor [Tenacibaculum agarivorans]|uniref:response regulator transcription factor n=1 Tax=Tenacibaculum agarivorans TaxID=1908389 RepID=UPI00094B7FAE|nr:LuxR C-terminal-related transcriptional regulator [Tenacibaculum agarivorans]
MNKQEIVHVQKTYFKLLEQQKFNQNDIDYTILEQLKPTLNKLAEIGNSVISVFDLYKKQHVFNSFNIGELLGYNSKDIQSIGEDFLDSKIHPTDYVMLMKNGIRLLKLFKNIPIDEKTNYKLISEFRVLNANNSYVRVIEQQQALKITSNGSIWLALSILDISPNQKNNNESIVSELLNFKTGQTIPFIDHTETSALLTQRELEILKFVKNGLLSKEISNKLSISIHTVNTHRQRVLEKLGANNSIEAVNLASKLGII